ncbi:aspartyl-phosphate phosphatase Spo0E family protein [Halalkalibacter akibai]|uniref:Aspartyl-phosphate phosphatase Spo0E family protein n=1 Tax=Halalkalibacter akibai (strain ATCC 43226 / DSM 21942 / CIP 109018 / JCM 9157 / 1139) TaxID=1236973 RepID=W4R036_HALA3|nr:aspartyl-phosphate phosphatase Spo0E family protein [Halalkalibacter akibai]GAE37706.1 hypothetical protein JCM9157_5025 [Halalkalibacter akibai JCM 9157]
MGNLSNLMIIEYLIEDLKRELHHTVSEKGLSHSDTIVVSQDLDKLIIKHQKFKLHLVKSY